MFEIASHSSCRENFKNILLKNLEKKQLPKNITNLTITIDGYDELKKLYTSFFSMHSSWKSRKWYRNITKQMTTFTENAICHYHITFNLNFRVHLIIGLSRSSSRSTTKIGINRYAVAFYKWYFSRLQKHLLCFLCGSDANRMPTIAKHKAIACTAYVAVCFLTHFIFSLNFTNFKAELWNTVQLLHTKYTATLIVN